MVDLMNIAVGLVVGFLGTRDSQPALALILSQLEDGAPQEESISNRGRGPIPIADNFLISLRRLPFSSQGVEAWEEGSWEVGGTLQWSSSIADGENPFFRIDGEALALVAALKYGVTPWFRVGLSVPVRLRMAGMLDGFTDGFHELFGLPPGASQRYPNGEIHVEITQAGGSRFEDSQTRADLGNLVLSAWVDGTEGNEWLPAAMVGLDLGIPSSTGDELAGDDGVSFQVSLHLSKRIVGGLLVHLFGAVAWYGDESLGEIRTEDKRLFGGVAIEWEISSATSFLIHAEWRGPLFSHGNDRLTLPSFVYSLGVKTGISDRLELQFAIVENELSYHNSADFGVQIGVQFSN